MKNEFTKSGKSKIILKINCNGSSGKGTVKAVLILAFIFFTAGLYAQPVITTFSPTSGPVGTVVTITGSGFDATISNNIVFFGAVMGTVSFSSATSLTVSVPASADFQYISVTNIAVNLTGYSLKPFLFTFPGGCKAPVFASGIGFTAGTNPYSVSIGDLDGDGKSDLAVANLGSNTVSVFRNNSTSGGVSFEGKVDFTTGVNPISVSITDLNGDGKPDLAIANSGSNTVSVLKNISTSGTVNFAAKVDFSTGSLPQAVSTGDIDLDGRPDMVVVNQGGNNTSVYRNTSSGGDINSGSFAAKVDFASGSGPKSVSIGDIDGDGKPDVVVANSASSDVGVLRNTSASGVINSGSFAPCVFFTTNFGGEGYNPWSVRIGDIDGDGKPELVVANFLDNINVLSTVSVFRNISTSGSVNFTARVNFYPGSKASSVSIGDLDGDGKPDVAVSNYNSSNVSVFRNTSISGTINTGSLTKVLTLGSGASPFSVCIGDLDGDGKPEISTANYYGSSVTVFRNFAIPAALQTAASGNGNPIANGSVTPGLTNFTDFGNANIGGNLIRTYSFLNTSTDSLSVDSIKISGSDQALFTPGSITPAGKIAPGSSKTFTVTFASTSSGLKTASVNIYSNILSGTVCLIQQTYTFAVQGTGVCPTINSIALGNDNPITNGSVTPSLSNFTDFGNVILTGNLIRTYTFRNTGTDSLSVDSIKISGTNQSSFTPGSITPAGKIAPGFSKTFTVTFAPTSSGLKTAAVNIFTKISSGNECQIFQTYTFAISGTGTVPAQAEALNFDGTNDNVTLPNALPQNLTAPSVSEITIEYWFKGSNLQSAVRFQTGAGYIVAGWGSLGSQKFIISSDGGTSGGVYVGAAATDGNWHHIAFTWKKNTTNGFKSYLDGALVQQRNSANVNLPVITSGGYLGAYNGTSEFLNGTLDEVRIWKRELSQTEISSNRFLQISSGTGLISSYHFNQGIGEGNNTGITTLTDATSNNYSGTLSNFTLNGPASNFVGSGPALIPLPGTINISVIPEGFYNAGADQLNASDTVRAYLHSTVSPYNVVDNAIAVIDYATFTGSFVFAIAPSGTYYIRVVHRNCIETWSKSNGEIFNRGTTMSYNFTTAAAQAFGDNQVQTAVVAGKDVSVKANLYNDASTARFAIFSGDINQDGTIDASDVSEVDNDAINSLSGYVNTDVTGDNFVDAGDVSIVDNNAYNSVSAVTP
jgi:hypothetical protein